MQKERLCPLTSKTGNLKMISELSISLLIILFALKYKQQRRLKVEEVFYYSALFKKIANQQKVLLNKGTGEHGITYVQSLVILFLESMQEGNGQEVTQKDVERYLSLRGSTVTHILDRMEERGLLTRERSKKDSRANVLNLTEKGFSAVPMFFQVLDGVESKMTEGMSKEEREQLRHLLEKVQSNIETEEWNQNKGKRDDRVGTKQDK